MRRWPSWWAVGLVAVLGAAVLLDRGAALYLGPLLFVLVPLAVGYFPGERTLARVRRPRRRCVVRGVVCGMRPPAAPPRLLARGGGLLGCSLAVRPPPVGLAAPSFA
jgi:hypothetical protein